ncbi:hypothetical protein GIB67_014093 [Kingdonia uniflora]|uniref:Pentatricopeptide repeat-containing protein n=1 Tax=Kingdonia uniflora TaxID=39325 RepID=A0A7J7KXP4_9MAGN|nr:hypothetical protein GIB67_014093 [Kingdonia uniflora]
MGGIIEARWILNETPERNEVSWSAMIAKYSQNGDAEEVLKLFVQKLPLTLYLAVLFDCSHCGLVDKAFRYFDFMERIYSIKPRGRHYTCMADFLARSGKLCEAEAFIKALPFQPEANAWASLLSGCCKYKNEILAERISMKVWELVGNNSAGYIMLSNTYALAGRWSNALKVQKLMTEKRFKKIGGCSWIKVRNQVHSFYCEGGCHGVLDLLMSKMADYVVF